MILLDYERITKVGEAIGKLGYQLFVNLDLKEPEYNCLKWLYQEKTNNPNITLLTGLSAAIIDYQLGKGGAEVFWATLKLVLSKHKLKNLEDLKSALQEFLDQPINARLKNQKKTRIEKLLKSNLADKILQEDFNKTISNPLLVWTEIAKALQAPMDRKTIVFSMKVLDIVSLIVKGEYANFPIRVPIPLNYHVTAMAIASGIVKTEEISYEWNKVEKLQNQYHDKFLRAWEYTTEKASKILEKDLSLLRLDSLVWQLSKTAKKHNFQKWKCQQIFEQYLTEAKANPQAAKQAAVELTYYML